MFRKTNKTEYLLLTSEGKEGINHLTYWVPEFLKLGIHFSILVRNEELLRLVKNEYRTLSILFAKSALDIEAVLTSLPNLKSIFFMSNHANNIHVLRFNDYKHIFLGSENSDRDSQITKIIKAFDELWLPSQSSIDKLSQKIDISNLDIHKIGRPQFQFLLNRSYERKEKSLIFIISSDSSIRSSSSITKEVIESTPKDYHINFVFDTKIDNRSLLFNGFQKQLSEFCLLNNRSYSIHHSLNDGLLAQCQFIICDTINYQQKFLAANALICLYVPHNIMPESFFANKYISFNGIPQFSNATELTSIFDNYEILKEKQDVFAEYWQGNSYTKQNMFAHLFSKVQ